MQELKKVLAVAYRIAVLALLAAIPFDYQSDRHCTKT